MNPVYIDLFILSSDGSIFFYFVHSCSTTAESLTNNNEEELQRRCQERQQEIDHMQQVLETKIQLLQEVGVVRQTCPLVYISRMSLILMNLRCVYVGIFLGGPASA